MPSCWVSPLSMKRKQNFYCRALEPPPRHLLHLLHLEVPKKCSLFLLFHPENSCVGFFFPLPSHSASSNCVITAAQISGSGQSTSDPWSFPFVIFLLPHSTVTKLQLIQFGVGGRCTVLHPWPTPLDKFFTKFYPEWSLQADQNIWNCSNLWWGPFKTSWVQNLVVTLGPIPQLINCAFCHEYLPLFQYLP